MPFRDKSNSRYKLLSLLAEAKSAVVPSSALIADMGISRQGVAKLIRSLRGEGLEIISIPRKGYALEDICNQDALNPTLIDYLLKDDRVFSKCVYIEEVDSTQQVLKSLAAQDAPEGIIVTADHQTRGRGRRGRTWLSPRGKNLCFSTLLRPELPAGDAQLLSLAAGLAVRGALRERFGVEAELKWPNDVLSGGKKICGILSEAASEPGRIHYVITGIGVNTNLKPCDIDAEMAETVTSVLIETGEYTPRPLLLSHIFSRFSALIQTLCGPEGKTKLLADYRANCATLGRKVRVTENGREYIGVAEDINEQGAIIVNTGGRAGIFAAADVQHLRQI